MARLVIGGRIVLTLSSQWRWSFVQIVFWRLHFTIFHLRVFRGQEKHGHAVNTQGACSQICCGESPRALGQRVPLGDRKTATLEPSAKHMWSCGSGVSVLCSSKVMPWVFARTPTERGSLFLCPLQQVFGRGTFQTDFSWCVDRQDKPTDSARHTRKSRTHLWLPAWWLDWSLVAGLSWHCPHNDVGAVQIVSWRLHFTIFHLRVFRGQEKHGHAVNTQGACSQICCGESPRALGQRVPLGDRKTATLEPSAKHMWSCGSGVFGPLQQQSHAMSVCKNANRTGLTLSMPSSNRCLAEARFKQIFLDASIGKTNQQTVQDSRGKAGRTCGCPHDG